MDTTPTRTTPLPLRSGPLAVNTNVSSTAFFDRLQNNRKLLLPLVIGVLGLTLVVVACVLFYNHRSATAAAQLSAAMDTYNAPIRTPEQPVAADQKSFGSVDERAKAANAEFAAVANTYGMTDAGRNARYLQGVTAMTMGENETAESLLKKSADSWNHDVATLAELSLAGLYRSTGREALAVDTYNRIISKPSNVVPAGLAQLQLAGMYTAAGKTAEANKIYAAIKDKDPKSAAAQLATEKLAGPATR